MSVRIDGAGHPYVVLSVHARRPCRYGGRAVQCLQSVAGLLGAALERARAEEVLRASNRRLKNLLESITEGFFVVDYDERFTYLNPAGEAMLRHRGADLVGQRIWDAFPDSEDSVFQEQYRRAMRENEPVAFEGYYEPLQVWFSVDVYPYADGGAVYFRDVTERKRLEQEILRVAEEERRRIGQHLHDGLGAPCR